jgi:uridine kinase
MIDRTLDLIESALSRIGRTRSALVALTGIDGSGKGYVTQLLAQQLSARALRTLVINVGRWLNAPDVWSMRRDPARYFYRYAVRFDEMFDTLVLPLRDTRSVLVKTGLPDEISMSHAALRYAFSDVDVILLEGIYLFKRQFVRHYDLRVWIDCSFETALERAVTRARVDQRSLKDTTRVYETIYFPAQLEHLIRDAPREAADTLIVNDYRLQSVATDIPLVRTLH